MSKTKPYTGFMRQFVACKRDIARLEKTFPGCTKVATLTFPRSPTEQQPKDKP